MRRPLILFALGLGAGIPGSAAAGDDMPALKMSYSLLLDTIKRQAPHFSAPSPLQLLQAYGLSLPGNEPAPLPNLPDQTPLIAELAGRVRMWEARGRDDLALETLNKLLRIAPSDDPETLALLAPLQIRMGHIDEARQTLERLRSAHPDHPAVARIATQLRMLGPDKDKVRQARRLAKSGRDMINLAYSRPAAEKRRMRAEGLHRIQSAIAIFRSLYRDVPPTGDNALEYWQLVADTDYGWMEAYVGLNQLVRDNPGNDRYELALAEHLARRLPIRQQVFHTFAKLADTPEYGKQTRESWRRALLRLDLDQENKLSVLNSYLPQVRAYLKHDPNDSMIRSLLAKAETRRRLLSDPDYQAGVSGLALLDNGNLELAEERIQQALNARPNDAEVLGGMGLLRLKQGHHAEAQGYFLLAQKLAPSAKWSNLARTAQYWGLLRQAKDAANTDAIALAKQKYGEARKLSPREPAALIGLAQLYESQSQIDAAEQSYRQALALEPDNNEALTGLAMLYLQNGREQDYAALQNRLSPLQRQRMEHAVRVAQASKLWQQADELIAQQQQEQAIPLLERAARLDDTNPWLRYDLARLYAERGQVDKGQALFDELLQRTPHNAEALYATALFQSGQDRDLQAMATLEQIAPAERSSNMTHLQRQLWTGVQKQRVLWMERNGQHEQAQALLARIEHTIGDDRDMALDVADVYIAAGDIGHARKLAARHTNDSTDWQLRQALLLAKSSSEPDGASDAELNALIERIAISGPLTREQQADLDGLRRTLALHRAEALHRQGSDEEALQLLQALRQPTPPDSRVLLAEADILRSLHRWNEAEAIYRGMLAHHRDDEATLALIDSAIEQGETAKAQQLIDRAWHEPPRNDVDFLSSLLGRTVDLGDSARAEELTRTILAVSPQHARTLRYASRMARKDGQLDRSIDYLQRALASEQSGEPTRLTQQDLQHNGEPQPAETFLRAANRNYRELAELLDKNTSWLSASFDWHSRAGTAGTSTLDLKETTFEWKRPEGEYGSPYLRADVSQVAAGTLDKASYAARSFGSMALCLPLCGSGGAPQSASGIAFDAGVIRDDLRVDIGTTPLGFPVQTLVGGMLMKGDWRSFSYSVDVSRRPLTSSLLSYAGTRDPRTGQVWGGVQASGVRLGLSRDDGGAFGAWSSLGLHALTGKNVQSNNRMQLMAGGYWRIINEENRLFTVGVTGMHWRFRQDAGEYSFGHGGYYSPQNYTSLSFPVTYGERSERFSYRVRAAVSTSRSSFAAAPYFPTDPALQSTASALSGVNGITPMYAASSSSGVGTSLSGEWEYQLNRQWFVGGVAEIDRSTNYSPNRFMVYLRHSLDHTAAKPVSFPPEPMIPTSQF